MARKRGRSKGHQSAPRKDWKEKEKPHLSGGTIYDPGGANAALKLKKTHGNYEHAVKMSEEFANYQYLTGPGGPHWGLNIATVDPRTGQAKQTTFARGVHCPATVDVVNKLTGVTSTEPKHPIAKPVLHSKGCNLLEYDWGSTKPGKIYFTQEMFYLDEFHWRLYERKRFNFDKQLIIGCHHCVNDLVNALIARNPELFVDIYGEVMARQGHTDIIRIS